jgi:hypothetical protein
MKVVRFCGGRSPLRINAGFFVFKRQTFDYMKDGEDLVVEPFTRLSGEKQLLAYPFDGFWRNMDTFKDKQTLDEMWSRGEAPSLVGAAAACAPRPERDAPPSPVRCRRVPDRGRPPRPRRCADVGRIVRGRNSHPSKGLRAERAFRGKLSSRPCGSGGRTAMRVATTGRPHAGGRSS